MVNLPAFGVPVLLDLLGVGAAAVPLTWRRRRLGVEGLLRGDGDGDGDGLVAFIFGVFFVVVAVAVAVVAVDNLDIRAGVIRKGVLCGVLWVVFLGVFFGVVGAIYSLFLFVN